MLCPSFTARLIHRKKTPPKKAAVHPSFKPSVCRADHRNRPLLTQTTKKRIMTDLQEKSRKIQKLYDSRLKAQTELNGLQQKI